MPELPEVENIAQGLRDEVTGLVIREVVVKKAVIVRGPYRRRWRQAAGALAGRRIVRIGRRAKRLIIVTDGAIGLVVQLGMTGTIRITGRGEKPARHTHFVLRLSGGKELRFVDPRRFGKLWFVEGLDGSRPEGAMAAAGMSELGPEPLEVTVGEFGEILNSRRQIKSLLLDQKRLAGLGNIYTDEALFAAGIHPATQACVLSAGQAARLWRAVRSVIRRSIRQGGTTFSDYRNVYGQMGRFRRRLRVYQRTGQACRRCGAAIEREVIGGRSSHFCPVCQPRS